MTGPQRMSAWAPDARAWIPWLLVAVLSALAGAAAAGEGVVITLRATASVAAGHATLADIADVAADPATIARLAPVAVQELPDLGRRTIDAAQVRAAVARLVVGRPLTITGSCEVERASLTISSERFSAAAEEVIRAKVGADTQIAIARPATTLVVAEDAATPVSIVADALVDDPIGEVPVRLRVLRAGRELGRGLVVLHVRALRDQLVAARPIQRGAIIGLGDLRVEAREARPGEADHPASIDAVIGWQTKVEITPGMVITRRLAQPVPAVRGGRGVELVFIQDQLALAAPGIALGDGAIGDVIQVRRTSDNRAIAAKVIAEGRAQVNF